MNSVGEIDMTEKTVSPLPAAFVAIDLEMTGLAPKKDRILEIGAVRFVNGEIEAVYESLVDPECAIPEGITELTGITEEMVKGQPKIAELLPGLLAFLGELPLVGHNLMFDYAFLKRAMVNCGYSFERDGIDTLAMMRKMRPELPSKALAPASEALGVTLVHHHRALADAEASGRILIALAGELPAGTELAKTLNYKIKKEQPAGKNQLEFLTRLCEAHQLDPGIRFESLTKNEASRLIDRIVAEHGRI